MGKMFVWFFVVIFISSFCLAVDEWGDMNVGNISGGENPPVVENVSGKDVTSPIITNESVSDSDSGVFYTVNFYIAIGLVIFVLIVFIIILWLWIRGAKNQWE